MKNKLTLKIFVCFFTLCLCLYSYLEAHNQMTKLRLELPKISKELNTLKEENLRLKYEIESFESPQHLMALLKTDAFSHLRFPQVTEILQIDQGIALELIEEMQPQPWKKQLYPTVVFGAK